MARSVCQIAAAFAAAPVAAAALPLDCAFETVCFMQEPCAPSAWTMSFSQQDADFQLVSDTGERIFKALGDADGHRAFVSEPNAVSVATLTVAEDGTAIYSEQSLSGGYAVTEYGFCRKAH